MNLVIALFAFLVLVSGFSEEPIAWIDSLAIDRHEEKVGADRKESTRSDSSCRYNPGPVKQTRLVAEPETLAKEDHKKTNDSSESTARPSTHSDADRNSQDEPHSAEDAPSAMSTN